jgi:hypothetical protein
MRIVHLLLGRRIFYATTSARNMAEPMRSSIGVEMSSYFAHRSTMYASNIHDKLLALEINETTWNETIAGVMDKARDAIELQGYMIADLLELAEKQNHLLEELLLVIALLCSILVFAGICAASAKVIAHGTMANKTMRHRLRS